MKKVLIVEDEDSQRNALSIGLQKSGYAIHEANDGQSGLEMALRIRPDIILTDLRMPNMTGMEMIHKLRVNEWGKTVPIVILTNYENTDNQIDQIITDYPAYYLLKVSSSIDDIVAKIKELTQ